MVRSLLSRDPSMRVKNVLLVDDDPDLLEALTDMLDHEGHRVSRVCDAERALALLSRMKQLPDVILVDCKLPSPMDGVELIETLRSGRGRESRIPVLAASAEPQHRERAVRAGAKQFFDKPIEVAALLDAIRAA
jgi:two-component system chemotaxis response regulator CheY